LNNPESGWAYARLSDQNKELLVTAPYSPDERAQSSAPQFGPS
jgi:hypothetical protein